MSADAADRFTNHEMVITRPTDKSGATGYECKNCGERKLITKSPEGIYYGRSTNVLKPGHEVVENAPADFNGWCPGKVVQDRSNDPRRKG